MYKFKNMAGGHCELLIFSMITGEGDGGISAHQVVEAIKDAGEIRAIDVRINSDGGDVFEAQAIYNFLKSQKAKINVYIDGICASAASLIACAGKIFMPSNALMMLHNPSGFAQGESEDMRAVADVLDKIRDSFAEVYASKTGQSVETCISLMENETWLNAQEAKDLGFADVIIEAKNFAGSNDAVKAERERIRELDELSAPGFESEIFAAKYENFKNAREVAYEILKSGNFSAQAQAPEKNKMHEEISASVPKVDNMQEKISMQAQRLNAMRGKK